MNNKLQWYEHANVISIVAFYMDPKEICKGMLVCKALSKHFSTNKIWRYIYNSVFPQIRVLDQSIWLQDESSCIAKQAFLNMCKARKGQFRVEPVNKYRVFLYGR